MEFDYYVSTGHHVFTVLRLLVSNIYLFKSSTVTDREE